MASFRSLSTFLSFFSLFRVLARSVEKSRSVFLDFGQSENERFSGGGDTCSPPVITVRFLNSCSKKFQDLFNCRSLETQPTRLWARLIIRKVSLKEREKELNRK